MDATQLDWGRVKDSLRARLRRTLEKFLAKHGYALTRKHLAGNDWNTLRPHISMERATPLCLDIGAHRGSVSSMLLEWGCHVEAFEPLPELAAELSLLQKRYPHRFHVHPIAIGEEDGEAVIRHHQHEDSSSLLPVAESFGSLYPQVSEVIGFVTVPARRLDSWLDQSDLPPGTPIDLIKIDVQGFEGHVLLGAAMALRRTRFLVLEVAFVPMYDGGILVDEVCTRLYKLGFRLMYAMNVYAAQADFVFRNATLEGVCTDG